MINLFGVGISPDDSARMLVDGLVAKNPNPSQNDIAAFLRLMSSDEQPIAARMLVERGVSPSTVLAAQASIGADDRNQWKNYLTIAAAAGAGFHGYRRNNSLGWALVWFTFGSLFPIITTVVAAAQGYGVRKA